MIDAFSRLRQSRKITLAFMALCLMGGVALMAFAMRGGW